MDFKDYWNEVHKQYSSDKITYDNYLDDYKDILNSCKTKVLDLGCGAGNNSLYLLKHGFKVVGVDYSDVALKIVNDKLKDVETILTDISNPLPFEDNSFDLVIADLSLHYFNKETTKQIMKEIKRILTENGYLIARVNSIDDLNYGAMQGKKIEDNYYYVNGYNKRFFSKEDCLYYFSIIGEVKVKEASMLRYSKPKKVLEVLVKKVNK